MYSVGMAAAVFLDVVQAVFLIRIIIGIFFDRKPLGKMEINESMLCILVFAPILVLLNVMLYAKWNNVAFIITWFSVILILSEKYIEMEWGKGGVLWLVGLFVMPVADAGLMLIIVLTMESLQTESAGFMMMLMLFQKSLYAVIFYLMSEHYVRKKLVWNRKYSMPFGVVVIYSLVAEVLLFSWIWEMKVLNQYSWLLLGAALAIVIMDAWFAVTVIRLSERERKEEEIRMLRLQNQFQEERLSQMQSEERRIRQMRHDYKNHLTNMEELLKQKKYTELSAYLKEVGAHYLKQSSGYIDTKNPVISASVNTKFRICHEEGIYVSSRIAGDYRMMDGFHIGIVLVNLLDNAIEASRSEIKKEICLEMKADEHYINIIVKNRISRSVLEGNAKLVTTKSDIRLHGFGLGHVREIIQNKDGMFEVYEESGYFCAHGLIPVRNVKVTE